MIGDNHYSCMDDLKRKKSSLSDFQWSAALKQKMKSVFGISELRPMQLQTMNVTMSGKDCILIMPTGGGKSLCFQLPALLSKGSSIVWLFLKRRDYRYRYLF